MVSQDPHIYRDLIEKHSSYVSPLFNKSLLLSVALSVCCPDTSRPEPEPQMVLGWCGLASPTWPEYPASASDWTYLDQGQKRTDVLVLARPVD